MIYAGLIHFNDELDRAHGLNHIIGTYTRTSPTIIKKNSLILCYGKLSNAQDMDEIWENASSVLMGRTFNKIQQCSFEKSDFKNLSQRKN